MFPQAHQPRNKLKGASTYKYFVGDTTPTPSSDLNLDRRTDFVNQVTYDPDNVFDFDDILAQTYTGISPENQALIDQSILLPEAEVVASGNGSASNDLQNTLDKLKRKERRKGAGQGFLAGFGKGFNLNLGSSPQPIQQPIAQTQSTTNLDPQKAGFSLQTEQGNWQVYAFIGLIGFALIMYGVNAKKGKDMDAGVSATPEIQPTTK